MFFIKKLKNPRSINLKNVTVFFSVALVFFACQKGTVNKTTNSENGPVAGNPNGNYAIPIGAGLEDVTNPDIVIGDGTAGSCTGQLFIDAVAQGGVIVFDCGSAWCWSFLCD